MSNTLPTNRLGTIFLADAYMSNLGSIDSLATRRKTRPSVVLALPLALAVGRATGSRVGGGR